MDALTRRTLLRRSGSTAVRALVGASALSTFALLRGGRTAPVGGRGPLGMLRPPGALAENEFLARCIRCTRCADACEPSCIRYFGPEAGVHEGTPFVLANSRACTLCRKCGPACPTGALQPWEQPEQVAMGTAVVDERLCVSHNGTGVCGACFTACPLRGRAIVQDFRNAPRVVAESCVGCGLCEEVCIVRDRRAIQVHTERKWSRT